MEWNEEQKRNILMFYDSIEDYERTVTLNEAKRYLADTDYIVIKAYEYQMTGNELDKDYNETFEKREQARKTIRQIEENLSN